MELEATNDDCTAHRAQLFRLAEDTDRATVERLLADGSIRDVHDTWSDQLAELIETRAPERSFTQEELRAEVAAVVGGRDPVQEGVWAWFPWSRRLVHLLDEADFVELRTSRNRYKITADEQAALARHRVGVVGLSVGQSVAVTMALERCAGVLHLADFDRLGLSNLNRLRASVHEVGGGDASGLVLEQLGDDLLLLERHSVLREHFSHQRHIFDDRQMMALPPSVIPATERRSM